MIKSNQKICIVSDLDGTLLPSSKIPRPEDCQNIWNFISDENYRFTIATGRTIQASYRYMDMLRLESPAIVFNGGMLYHPLSGERQILQALPDEAKAITAEILKENPHVGVEVLCAEDTWVINNTEYEKQHVKVCGVIPKYGTIPEVQGTWLKVLFAMSPDDMPAFMQYIADKHFQNIDFIRSELKFYEMLPVGNSKGSALKEYRKLAGMEDFKFIGFGDYDNDIEMLKASDFAVCPANAAESVKAVSDLILSRTCEEGAISELIDKILHQEVIL
ncbi:MAG: HAD-IIB family hydrolase [Oscillospiraceae bacterium]|nr:HAD-IIB family hydrolase [Oscillospiraceae bacterium]